MVSAIDATKPVDGVLSSKGDLRTNLAAAKAEIEALQNQDTNLLAALGLNPADALFPVILGDNLPLVPATIQAIIQALDAAIVVLQVASGGGPITLADISDILSPTEAQRIAFQKPADAGVFDTDFNFDEGTHAGKFIALDTNANSVTMTLPAAASINRDDGWLCRVIATSGLNFGAVSGPTDALRFQSNRFGATVTQTTVFLGLSRTNGLRALFDIYKDGSIYQVVGPGRVTETDVLTIGAPGSVNGSVLTALSLLAAAFPNVLDLGGTKQAGGARSIVRSVGGNTTLAQTDAGNLVRLTGATAATWDAPDLADGTIIEIRSKAGAGAITINASGALATAGGLTLTSGSSGAVRYFTDEIELIGTI